MSDFQVIKGFPEDYKSGHFALIGRTGSGKSYYCKYIIKNLSETFNRLPDGNKPVWVFVGNASAHDWTDPEIDGSVLVATSNVYTTWDKPIYEKLLKDMDVSKRGLLIFDDFKGVFNYHHDESFKNMFRVLRHMNVQLIVIVHAPNDIPPVARGNVDHVILAATSNLSMMKDLADNYLAGDAAAMKSAFKQIGSINGKPMLKLNTRTNTRAIHVAPPPSESGISTSATGTSEGAGNSSSDNSSTSLGCATIGMRSAAVTGTYNDASHNVQNVNLNTNIQAQIAQNKVTLQASRDRTELSRSLELEGVYHSSALKRLQDRELLKGLLFTPYLNGDNRDTAARIMSNELSNSSITPFNMWSGKYDQAFMQTYYPTISYQSRDKNLAAVSTYSPLAVAIVKNDRGVLAIEAAKACGTTGFQKVLSWVGIDSPPVAPVKSIGEAARARVRDLIVFRKNREKVWFTTEADRDELMSALRPALKNPEKVTDATIVQLSLEMLLKFYPDDYIEETKIIENITKLRTTKKPSKTIKN